MSGRDYIPDTRTDAKRALDDLLQYMYQRGLKRLGPNGEPGTYTIFPDGSALAIEIRLGRPV